MSIDLVRTLLTQLGTLAFVFAGFSLIIASASGFGRTWASRLMLVGVLLVSVASLVSPGWLP